MTFNLHPKKYFQEKFTPEQWRDIYKVRARLEAYKLRAQPYPEYPIEEPEVIREIQPTNKMILDKLHRIEVLKNDLENRLNTHLDKSKKKKNYKEYTNE